MRIIMMLGFMALLIGCSDKPAESFLKEKQQLIEKAKDTEDLLKAADDKRRAQLEKIQ